jgi:hypothetical protein
MVSGFRRPRKKVKHGGQSAPGDSGRRLPGGSGEKVLEKRSKERMAGW